MKHLSYFLLSPVICFVAFACEKSNTTVPDSIAGTWKMISVYDSLSGSISLITKPDSIQGDVIITFIQENATQGTFTGHTPTNEFISNPYFTGPNNSISIPSLGISQVEETWWGALFADNVTKTASYSFGGNEKLILTTTTSKRFTFQKQ